MKSIQELRDHLPQVGQVEWVGLRPARREEMIVCDQVEVLEDAGLKGDRTAARKNPGGKRHVTLFQWEHLPVIASLLGMDALDPEMLRRNIGVSGVNLQALKGRKFQIGTAVLEGRDDCHPCSRMDEIFGEGGYQAVRGHGGITARVVEGGMIERGAEVRGLNASE